ncbi:RsmB/NOP family class I SAM-dependent RNA methyltransferase [Arcicella sp. LKC2W]|uniref:RsmB/NOP family class I SAM-dependent RNA methyltransferase n=1 Tax=Arcicella sp. LKC2W TaxID=2984198 RepID=UPI002B21F308|nr:RsmB/NOP family class I SAM-dependent RNA methyltransferase [Arcicella sp. LKC2W]MEA5460002.1 RsmB/NOP family class I SAM-dependent RNA methyltransferase [Arcicella sp. LKC2W]
MRLHRPLILATVKALQEIFLNDKPRQADRVIEATLKSNKQWGSRDRAFIAEHTYEIVRNWRLVLFVNEMQADKLRPQFFFQMVGSWLLIKKQLNPDGDNIDFLPKWEEFSFVNEETILARLEEAQKVRKIRESIPDWLDEMGEAELGTEKWTTEIRAMNQQAPVILRANSLKTNPYKLQDLLVDIEIETIIPENLPDALMLKQRGNIFKTEFFKNGLFEVQDSGSQMIAPFLDVKPGMRVIDACAGAGGKTLHLASLMQNKGRIVAMDVEEYKLTELMKRAKRNGVNNVEVKLIEPKTLKRLQESADRLLLDVPCSGLGVIRRNPDSKWKLTPEFIENLRKIQWDILTQYSSMLKKGGKMVFATCSLLPSESEAHVQRLLAEQPDKWELLKEQRTSPATDGYDGFYMACLLKK